MAKTGKPSKSDPYSRPAALARGNGKQVIGRTQAASTSGMSSGTRNARPRPSGGSGGSVATTTPVLPDSPIIQDLLAKGIITEGMSPEQIMAIVAISAQSSNIPIDINALMEQIKATYAGTTGDIMTAGQDWMQQLYGNLDPNNPLAAIFNPADPTLQSYAGGLAQLQETSDLNLANDLAWFQKQQQAYQDYMNGLIASIASGQMAPTGSGGGGGGGYGGGGYGGGGGDGSGDWGDQRTRVTAQERVTSTADSNFSENFAGDIQAILAANPYPQGTPEWELYQDQMFRLWAKSGQDPMGFLAAAVEEQENLEAQRDALALRGESNAAWETTAPGRFEDVVADWLMTTGNVLGDNPETEEVEWYYPDENAEITEVPPEEYRPGGAVFEALERAYDPALAPYQPEFIQQAAANAVNLLAPGGPRVVPGKGEINIGYTGPSGEARPIGGPKVTGSRFGQGGPASEDQVFMQPEGELSLTSASGELEPVAGMLERALTSDTNTMDIVVQMAPEWWTQADIQQVADDLGLARTSPENADIIFDRYNVSEEEPEVFDPRAAGAEYMPRGPIEDPVEVFMRNAGDSRALTQLMNSPAYRTLTTGQRETVDAFLQDEGLLPEPAVKKLAQRGLQDYTGPVPQQPVLPYGASIPGVAAARRNKIPAAASQYYASQNAPVHKGAIRPDLMRLLQEQSIQEYNQWVADFGGEENAPLPTPGQFYQPDTSSDVDPMTGLTEMQEMQLMEQNLATAANASLPTNPNFTMAHYRDRLVDAAQEQATVNEQQTSYDPDVAAGVGQFDDLNNVPIDQIEDVLSLPVGASGYRTRTPAFLDTLPRVATSGSGKQLARPLTIPNVTKQLARPIAAPKSKELKQMAKKKLSFKSKK